MASPPAPSTGLSSLVPSVSFSLWDKNLCRSWKTAFCSSVGELAGHPCGTDTSPVPVRREGQGLHTYSRSLGPGRIPRLQSLPVPQPRWDWPLPTPP